MDRVAAMAATDRADLFNETAARVSVHEVVVEKDFWVCWLLKQLFTMPELNGWLTFKGGTSLSKCFHLIHRFSEDVDLAVDFQRLGFTGERDPRRADLSYTKRQPLLDEMLGACREFIAGPLMKSLQDRIADILGRDGWTLEVSSNDLNTLEFEYPPALGVQLDYIRPRVILELGTHAEPIPRGEFPVRPFAADQFPGLFREPDCHITTVLAHRTFWEKATILHVEYHRALDKPLLPGYSRHYADVAMMAQAPAKNEALADLDLLQSVCRHKDRFYHCGWARHLEAKPGTFHLLPRKERLGALRRDYQDMRVMFFSEAPSFDTVLDQLATLEREINGA
ncbi:MAG TPA: nucleotidyl transferase AbiEii/AbiGii toxin family protein [Phycisphaerae bacterium]|nr:nucleotidyl transferase AbiEii/AbiGii toxin family protein [Phycisphaerae bacterium]